MKQIMIFKSDRLSLWFLETELEVPVQPSLFSTWAYWLPQKSVRSCYHKRNFVEHAIY